MKQETHDKITEALRVLDDATKVQGLAVLALVMPHGTRGLMNVQMLGKGDDKQIAHKLYECMRFPEVFPCDLRQSAMSATAELPSAYPQEN